MEINKPEITGVNYHRTPILLGTVYNDSIVYKVVYYQDCKGYNKGDVLFTYKIINDTPGTQYALAVNNGNGSGNYNPTTVVVITANAPAIGKMFDKWTGDISALADVNASTTTVTMPSGDVTITATYVDLPTYTLTITNGTGSGDYLEAASVGITPNTPPAGKEFDVWTGDISYIDNANLASVTVTMPALSISLTAIYRDTTTVTYTLTVTNGTGSGDYIEAAVVPIVANTAPVDQMFDVWTGDIGNVADVNDSSTIITMPASIVNITATYISTEPATYTITFTIDDGSLPLANSSVYFNNEVKLSNASGVTSFSNVSSGTDLSYSVFLPGYNEFTSQLSVIDANVNESVSMTLSTSINDAFANIEIYPNPASDVILIKNIENVLNVNIYSISNILVRAYSLHNDSEIVMDVSGLSKGMYFIQLITDNEIKTKQQIVY